MLITVLEMKNTMINPSNIEWYKIPGMLPGQEPLKFDKYKLIYQPLTKVGCKTFKTWLLILDTLQDYEFSPDNHEHQLQALNLYNQFTDLHYEKGNGFSLHLKSHEKFGMFSNNELSESLKIKPEFKNYYKILVVRDPWNRIASCFVDKFIREVQYSKASYLQSWFLNEITTGEKEIYQDANGRITFPGFIEALHRIFKNNLTEYLDPHWVPQSFTSKCFIDNFDSIIKIEDIDKDFKLIQNKLGLPVIPSSFTVVDRGLNSEEKKQSSKYDYFFTDTELIDKVGDIFVDDVSNFSYIKPKVVYNGTTN